MKIRYQISEKWNSKQIIRAIEALEFCIDFWELECNKSTLTVKMITGSEYDDSATADRIKNKRYEIRLNYSRLDTEEELIKAIMHEMTHVKQFMYNGLRLYGKAAKWENQDFPEFDYWFAPWEMEARAMEDPLYHLFEDSY